MKKFFQLSIGMAFGGFLFWLLFRNTDWAAVGTALGEANHGWLLLSTLLVVVTFVTRIFRWGYIVRTAGPVSFRAMFSATQIGFLGNFTLPGRVGEVIRAAVLSRLTGLAFSRCFAFVALDRVTDLFGLFTVMIITLVFFNPTEPIVLPELPWPIDPDTIRMGAMGTGAVMLGIIACFVVLYLNKNFALRIVDATIGRASQALGVRMHGMLEQFADGMHVFKSAGDMSRAIAWSLVTWGLGTACYDCTLRAFNIDVPWYTAFVIMAFLAVFISLPSTPGFVGPFHLGIVAAVLVVAPGTDLDVVKAAALIAHLLQLLPVLVVGCACLYMENLGLMELRRATDRETAMAE
jgi:uncharacterized protein (TIRG00374 family)